ncbi:putative transcriptional regulator, AsnC family [Nitrospira sp. KM1]|uniref:winged helix-turn-helix transcriptional regulator n=1 Tax=Nitrospira sp. KM1 TaxID=1936990 RepID=UPI0013A7A02D|nr:winged helix-turn-helix transcriptional regulator [Nitrospira sp. KM1]BCA54235.1 putative transcriptional regulator, AsnC family [Nitrospira sp. KM1]
MDVQGQRDLLVLSEVERNSDLTQRSLSIRLGVALGLTNLYLKRLARKGYIKITTIPRNRIRYLLTPQGVAEKTRLTYQYMDYSLSYYRDMRTRLKEMLASTGGLRGQRFVIYGTGELAELAYLSLKEMEGQCVGFLDDRRRDTFLSYPVSSPEDIGSWEFDKILLTDLAQADEHEEQLARRGVPIERVLRLGLSPNGIPQSVEQH